MPFAGFLDLICQSLNPIEPCVRLLARTVPLAVPFHDRPFSIHPMNKLNICVCMPIECMPVNPIATDAHTTIATARELPWRAGLPIFSLLGGEVLCLTVYLFADRM